jgi:predicted phage-related endonuclease
MAISEEQESWAASRVGGLGGTDVTALLGASKWRTPIDVWQAKVDPQSVPDIDNEILWFGRALEPVIRARYALRFNCEVVDPVDIGKFFPNSKRWKDQTLVVGREPWMLGAADGWIPSVMHGFEAKNVGFKTEDWGEEGSDDIPVAYYLQSAWYNQVYDSRGWNVAPMFNGHKLSQYRIPRDGDLEHDMYEAARAFWFDFIVPKIEPPVDQTESYGRYLARKFSLNTGTIIKDPSPEIIDWTVKMKAAEDAEKAAAADKQLANNHLRALIRDAQKAITPLGSIGWVRPKEGASTDWKAAAERLSALYEDARSADALPAADVIKEATSPQQHSAYLRAWWSKKKGPVEFGEVVEGF